MLKSRGVVAILLAAWTCAAASKDVAVPSIERNMSLDGRRDVSVHFYVDGHKRNKDANMDYGTSHAYVRAINALRSLLADRDNPIEAGLRRRGFGNYVEVNTGTAYLLKPGIVMPFSLSRKASRSDFGAFGKEDEEWGRDILVKQVLDNEKSARNVVVCIISNDPDLTTRHGAFHLDEEHDIMFFMLHAPAESVNAGIFKPYWSHEKWRDFLRVALDTNANDVANAIVDHYYALSETEKAGLEALVCNPEDTHIAVRRTSRLPRRETWTTTIRHNGQSISLDEDSTNLTPVLGQNELVASIVSPAGITYTRTWDSSLFDYGCLRDRERLFSDVTNALAKARKEGQKGDAVKQLADLAAAPDKPYIKVKLDSIAELVASVTEENTRLEHLHELEEKAKDIAGTVRTITESLSKMSPHDKAAFTHDCDDISTQLARCTDFIDNAPRLSTKDIALSISELEKLAERLSALEESMARRNKEIEAEIASRRFEELRTNAISTVERQLAAYHEDQISNHEGLSKILQRIKAAKDKDSLDEAVNAFNAWKPATKSATKTSKQVEADQEAEKFKNDEEKRRVDERNRKEKEAALQRKKDELLNERDWRLDTPANGDDVIQNRAELESLREKVKVAVNDNELKTAKAELENWKRVPIPVEGGTPNGGGNVLPFVLLPALVAGAGVAVVKLVRGRTAAKILCRSNEESDTQVVLDVRLNRAVRLDGKCGCPVDLVVICRKGEAEAVEFELRAPGKDVQLMPIAGTDKKTVGENTVVFDEGIYLLFENKVAMEPVGQIEFRRAV